MLSDALKGDLSRDLCSELRDNFEVFFKNLQNYLENLRKTQILRKFSFLPPDLRHSSEVKRGLADLCSSEFPS